MSYTPLQQQAARELLIRRRARKSLLDYSNAIDIPGKPVGEDSDPDTEFFQPVETTVADHHRLLLAKLETLSQTKHGRLMVFMPPGSAKSTYASVVFPSYYLGTAPKRKVILASYGSTLARKMGRRTRSIINQPRYAGIFNTGLSAESRAAEEFTLTNGSEYMSGGILSGITGNRANGIIIDDPIKGREDAQSEVIREKTWDAYENDLKTRLIPGGWICLIQTRWHEDDLAGRILPEGWNGQSGKMMCRDGMEWEVICLQARCEVADDPLGRERGEYLWPEWFDRQHWAQFEQNSRMWASLFQQRPTPSDGDLFKPDMMTYVEAIPAGNIQWVRGWDLASTQDDGDWTVGVKLGRMSDGRFIVADVTRARLGPDKRDALMLATASRDGRGVKIDFPQDPGQAGKSQVAYLTKQFVGYRVTSSPESGDKFTRAEPVAAQCNVGNVLMLIGPWNQKFADELRLFPNGTHDDQVDALSRAFNQLLTSGGFSISDELLHTATVTRLR